MQCYKCNQKFNDEPELMLGEEVAKFLCPSCHKIAVDELKERLSHSEEIGGESSQLESELDHKFFGKSNSGAFTGTGKTAGGGHRVIKDTKTQS